LSAVQKRYLPVTAGTGTLTADDELARFTGLFVDGVSYDRCHHGSDKTNSHYDHNFLAFLTGRFDEGLKPFEFRGIFSLGRDRKFFSGWTYRKLTHNRFYS